MHKWIAVANWMFPATNSLKINVKEPLLLLFERDSYVLFISYEVVVFTKNLLGQ